MISCLQKVYDYLPVFRHLVAETGKIGSGICVGRFEHVNLLVCGTEIPYLNEAASSIALSYSDPTPKLFTDKQKKARPLLGKPVG